MSYDAVTNLDNTVRSSRVFTASMGALAFAALGRAQVLLANPNPTSGQRLVHLIGLTLVNSSAVYATVNFWKNPTLGLPTGAIAIPAQATYIKPNTAAVSSSVCSIMAASGTTLTIMSGGTPLPPIILPPNTMRTIMDMPILIDPGASLGIDATFGSATTAANSTITPTWWEEG